MSWAAEESGREPAALGGLLSPGQLQAGQQASRPAGAGRGFCMLQALHHHLPTLPSWGLVSNPFK